MTPMTYALFYGNRGFFPSSLISSARQELPRAVRALGNEVLEMPADATRYGAVETPDEGRRYAEFLAQNRGKYDGVILSLPNFGDETGAVAALREAGVPILIQAYPDEMDKMGPATRRDSFCGKLSVMDVFHQNGIPFTALAPHTVHPAHARFRENLTYFDRVCRVVRAGRRMTVGALGARTTPFRTVRIDELTLEKHGITVETMDLSDVMARMRSLKPACQATRRSGGRWMGLPPGRACPRRRGTTSPDSSWCWRESPRRCPWRRCPSAAGPRSRSRWEYRPAWSTASWRIRGCRWPARWTREAR